MSEEEVSAKIKEMKSKGDWIIDSMKNPIISSQTCEQIGFLWSLRINTKYNYSLDRLAEIKQETGASYMTVSYQRGLWIKLHFYKIK